MCMYHCSLMIVPVRFCVLLLMGLVSTAAWPCCMTRMPSYCTKCPTFTLKMGESLSCLSDVLHLIKTVRNCWYPKAWSLWVCYCWHLILIISRVFLWQRDGSAISWRHLGAVYAKDIGRGSGLALVPKLTQDWTCAVTVVISKMRVDLAAQVCYYLLHT